MGLVMKQDNGQPLERGLIASKRLSLVVSLA